MDYVQLNDGNKIPAIGFGVFMIPNDGPTYEAVLEALKVGYRHIDTAAAYMNEQDVGRAVRDSGILREEVFVTTKLWPQDYAAGNAPAGIDLSLKNLGLDYIDLMLLHQPYGPVDEAWAALEEAKAAGKIRSIGVSNMNVNIWNKWVRASRRCLPSTRWSATRSFSSASCVPCSTRWASSSSAGTRWATVTPSCSPTRPSPHSPGSTARTQVRSSCASRPRMA